MISRKETCPCPAQQHDKQLLTDAVVQTNLTRAMTSQVTVGINYKANSHKMGAARTMETPTDLRELLHQSPPQSQ